MSITMILATITAITIIMTIAVYQNYNDKFIYNYIYRCDYSYSCIYNYNKD